MGLGAAAAAEVTFAQRTPGAQSLAGEGEMGRLRLSVENGQPQWRAGRQVLGYRVSFIPGYRVGHFPVDEERFDGS